MLTKHITTDGLSNAQTVGKSNRIAKDIKCQYECKTSSESVNNLINELVGHHLEDGLHLPISKEAESLKETRKLKLRLFQILLCHRKNPDVASQLSPITSAERVAWMACLLASQGKLHQAQTLDSCLTILQNAVDLTFGSTVDSVLALLVCLTDCVPEESSSVYHSSMSAVYSCTVPKLLSTPVLRYPHQSYAPNLVRQVSWRESALDSELHFTEYPLEAFHASSLINLEDRNELLPSCGLLSVLPSLPSECYIDDQANYKRTAVQSNALLTKTTDKGDNGRKQIWFQSTSSSELMSHVGLPYQHTRKSQPRSHHQNCIISNAKNVANIRKRKSRKNKCNARAGARSWMRLCDALPGCGISSGLFANEKQPTGTSCLGAGTCVLPRELSPSSTRLCIPSLPPHPHPSGPLVEFPSTHFAAQNTDDTRLAVYAGVGSSDEGYASSQGSTECLSLGQSCNSGPGSLCHPNTSVSFRGGYPWGDQDPSHVWEDILSDRKKPQPTWLQHQQWREMNGRLTNKWSCSKWEQNVDLPTVMEAGPAVTHTVWYKLHAHWCSLEAPLSITNTDPIECNNPANDYMLNSVTTAMPELSVLPATAMCQHALYAVIGIPSSSFRREQGSDMLQVTPGSCYEGVTPEAVLPLLLHCARTGTVFRRLELLCDSYYSCNRRGGCSSEENPIVSAFVTALREILHSLRGEVLELLGPRNFLSLLSSLDEYMLKVEFLGKLCHISIPERGRGGVQATLVGDQCNAGHHEAHPTDKGLAYSAPKTTATSVPSPDRASAEEMSRPADSDTLHHDGAAVPLSEGGEGYLPGALALLGELMNELVVPCSRLCAGLLLRLLRAALTPFFRSLERWVFEGIPCPSVVSVNAEAAACRDHRYLTDAFSVPTLASAANYGGERRAYTTTTVPTLFNEVLRTALRAGTEVSLLRICHPSHPLLVRRFHSLAAQSTDPLPTQPTQPLLTQPIYKLLTLSSHSIQPVNINRHFAIPTGADLDHRSTASELQNNVSTFAEQEVGAALTPPRLRLCLTPQQLSALQLQCETYTTAVSSLLRGEEEREEQRKESRKEQRVESIRRAWEERTVAETARKALAQKEYNARWQEQHSVLSSMRAAEEQARASRADEEQQRAKQQQQLQEQWQRQQDGRDEYHRKIRTAVENYYEQVSAVTDTRDARREQQQRPDIYSRNLLEDDGIAEDAALSDSDTEPLDHQGSSCTEESSTADAVTVVEEQWRGKSVLAGDDVSIECKNIGSKSVDRDGASDCGISAMSTASDVVATPGDEDVPDLPYDNDCSEISVRKNLAVSSTLMFFDENVCDADERMLPATPLTCTERNRHFDTAPTDDVGSRATRDFVSWKELSRDTAAYSQEAQTIRQTATDIKNKFLMSKIFAETPCEERTNLNLRRSAGRNTHDDIFARDCDEAAFTSYGRSVFGEEALEIKRRILQEEYGMTLTNPNGSEQQIQNYCNANDVQEILTSNQIVGDLNNVNNKRVIIKLDDEGNEVKQICLYHNDANGNSNSLASILPVPVAKDSNKEISSDVVANTSECTKPILLDAPQIRTQDESAESEINIKSNQSTANDTRTQSNYIASKEGEVDSRPVTTLNELITRGGDGSAAVEPSVSGNSRTAPSGSVNKPSEQPGTCVTAADSIHQPLELPPKEHLTSSVPLYTLHFDHTVDDPTPLEDIIGTALTGHPTRGGPGREYEGSSHTIQRRHSDNLHCGVVTSELRETKKYNNNISAADSAATIAATHTPLEHSPIEQNSADREDEEVPDCLSAVPVYMLRALSEVVNVQASVCSASVVHALQYRHALPVQLHAVRDWLLMQDSAYAGALVAGLMKLNCSGRLPSTVLTPVVLNGVLTEALAEAVRGTSLAADNLTFEVPDFDELPAAFTHTSVLPSCVRLQYRVSWPCCLVLAPPLLADCSRVGTLLLTVAAALHAADGVFTLTKLLGRQHGHQLTGSAQFHSVCLYRHQMSHFVRVLHHYLLHQVVSVVGLSPEDLSSQDPLLEEVPSLDALSDRLNNAVAALIKRCFLSVKATPVLSLVLESLSLVHLFGAQLAAHRWTNGQQPLTPSVSRKSSAPSQFIHPAFAALQQTHAAFQMKTAFLCKLLVRVQALRRVQHVEELLTALDYTAYYTGAARTSEM